MRTWNMTMATALVLAAACGGDDDKSSGPSTSSIDSKLVSELDGEEARTLCEYLNSVNDKTITLKQACEDQAVNDNDNKEDCEQERDDCVKNEEQDPGGELEDCNDLETNTKCTAKVSKVKECLKGLLEADDAEVRKASCDAIDATTVPIVPSACSGLPTACLSF